MHGTSANSGDACILSSDGPWDVALANNQYDYLVLQPHENTPSTEAEITAMQGFLSLTTAQLVIYEAYPDADAVANIADYYMLPDQQEFRQTQAEFSQVRAAFPNAKIIPAMEVLIEVDAMARNAEVPGINTAQDLYRDPRHLNEFGRYILGLTHFSAITGLDPSATGLDLHTIYSSVTDVQALSAQEAVRRVLGFAAVLLPAAFWFLITGLLMLFRFSAVKK